MGKRLKRMAIKCKFGQPVHGWLPVSITIEDDTFEMDVSSVPLDPIDSLIADLDRVLDGGSGEVFFHLEPEGYYLQLKYLGVDQFSVRFNRMQRRSGQSETRIPLCETQGTKTEIMLPFWRALREFASHSYPEPHWPCVDKSALDRLTHKVKRPEVR